MPNPFDRSCISEVIRGLLPHIGEIMMTVDDLRDAAELKDGQVQDEVFRKIDGAYGLLEDAVSRLEDVTKLI